MCARAVELMCLWAQVPACRLRLICSCACLTMPAPLRVVLTRWLIYIFAALPGFMMLRSHLNDTIGRRPWFQDAELPLDYLSVKLLMAELSGGTGEQDPHGRWASGGSAVDRVKPVAVL